MVHKARAYLGFCSKKRLGVFLFLAVQGYPRALNSQYPFIHLGGQRHCHKSLVFYSRTQQESGLEPDSLSQSPPHRQARLHTERAAWFPGLFPWGWPKEAKHCETPLTPLFSSNMALHHSVASTVQDRTCDQKERAHYSLLLVKHQNKIAIWRSKRFRAKNYLVSSGVSQRLANQRKPAVISTN